MPKFRINKTKSGFNVYLMRDVGNGWDKIYHSNYETREEAEQAIQRMQNLEMEQIFLQKRGCCHDG